MSINPGFHEMGQHCECYIEISKLKADLEEQCLLLGKSGSREAKHLTEIEKLKAELANRPKCDNDPGTTHYLGCECHETAWKKEVEKLKKQLRQETGKRK
jgi:hypothetical protein